MTRRIRPNVDLEHRRKSAQYRAAEIRVAGHVAAYESRCVAASARMQRTQVASLDLGGDSVVRKWRYRPLPAAHVVSAPMREDDDVAGRELDGFSIQVDDGSAFNDQMEEHKMLRPRSERGRHRIRSGREKAPGSRKFGGEEHRAIQLHAAQDFGERIHSVTRTYCKVPWPLRKAISFHWPSGQIIATLGYGCPGKSIAQL